MSVSEALESALLTARTLPQDGATVALAREYAQKMDDGVEPLWRIGPRLLEVLVELGMTTKARVAISKGETPEQPASSIDELRKRREARG